MFKKLLKVQERESKSAELSAYENEIISWIAPEFLRYERGKIWKIVMIAAGISAITLGIINQAWTFSLAIIAFVSVYYILNREAPKEVKITISDVGIKIGERRYPYGKIKAFWIIYDPPYSTTLTIRVSGDLLLDITIQLNGQNPAQIREVLLSKIPEMEGKTEPMTDIVSRLFKL